MKRWRPSYADILFLFEALGLACFALLCLQSGAATVLSYGLKLGGASLALFAALAAAAFLTLRAGISRLSRWEAGRFAAPPAERRASNLAASVPLVFLLLSPALNFNYLDRGDLQTRLALLGAFVAAAVLYLKVRDVLPLLRGAGGGKLRSLGTRWNGWTLRRRLLVLFAAAFLAYNVGALVLVQKGVTFSGDEPNYLLTTHSLLTDRDINLANNYADQDYFHFYNRADNPRLRLGVYGQYGKKGKEYIYPINLPGISVLMLPWYWLSQLFAGKALTFILKGSLAVWAVLLGLQVYLLAREMWKREGLALGLWLFYSFSAPVVFYALHLYPEIPIALISVFVYRKVVSGEALSKARLLFLGFLLGTFPWFGLKYIFILGPLALVALLRLWTSQRPRAKVIWFLILPVVGTAAFAYFVYALYGTFSPFAVYEGIISPERSQALKAAWLAYPLYVRADSFFDYFLDQRDGLLLYAPFYFLAFAGAVEALRRSKRQLAELAFIALPFLLNYAFFTHRQGHCPQGRVLAPISWIGAILVGHFLAANRNRIFAAASRLAAAATAGMTALLFAHPWALYQSTTHEFTQRPGEIFLTLSSLKTFWPFVLPSFTKMIDNRGYLPNYFWIGGAASIAVLYAIFRNRPGPAARTPLGRIAPVVALLALAFGLWVYYPRTVLYGDVPLTYADQQKMGFYLFPTGGDVVAKNQGELYLHVDREYRIFFAAKRKLPSVRLVFGSKAGTHDVSIRQFDLPLFQGRTDREMKELVFTPAAAVPIGKLFVYEIVIDFRKLSGENLKVDPYLLRVIPGR